MFYIQRRDPIITNEHVLYRGHGKVEYWVPLEQIDKINPFLTYIEASQTLMKMEGRCEIFGADLIITTLLYKLRISNNCIKQLTPVRGPETLEESATTPEQAIPEPTDRQGDVPNAGAGDGATQDSDRS